MTRALLATAVLIAAAACSSPPPKERAVDKLIDAEKDPEARKELEQIRDRIDAEMEAKVKALDDEIARLRAENEELKKRAAAAGK